MADENKKENGKEEESVSGGILEGIGKLIPGLGGLLKSMVKSPAFREKLEQIDKEVERKIKETPLKKTEGRAASIPGGIPPGVRGGVVGRKFFMKGRADETAAHTPQPQKRPADVFDEPDHIKVIAEIPGVEENAIRTNLQDDVLTISADVPDHEYHQELKLPCRPKGNLERKYKNGILEVRITK